MSKADGQNDEQRVSPPEILWRARMMAAEYESSNSMLGKLVYILQRFRDRDGNLVSPVAEIAAERGRLQSELHRVRAETAALKARYYSIEADLSKINIGWNQAQKDDKLMRETEQRRIKLTRERAESKKELKEYLVKWRLLDGDGNFMGLNYTEMGNQ